MRTIGALLSLLSLAVPDATGQTLRARIDQILAGAPNAIWGIHVVDLRTGATVYARNERQLFVPASNTKLFSTALALSRLGPDYRFKTAITAPASLDGEGRVAELRLVGGGDPHLSGRVLPYVARSVPGNPLQHIEEFAQRLVDSGLRRVEGDIIGDDSAYVNEPFPEGWAVDDPLYGYGAPVSALFVNDGTFRLRVAPGTQGSPPSIETIPALQNMLLHNRATSGGAEKLRFTRLPGSNEITITGSVDHESEFVFAVEDPALFAAESLREALLKRGVRISGLARVEHSPAPGVVLMTHESRPLVDALTVINKESVNLHAEVVLLETARVRSGIGSRDEAIKELGAFLEEIGANNLEYVFEDGSGLSRKTLVSPTTVTTLLRHMYGSPHKPAWLSTLPVGGEEGTLEMRFGKTSAARRIRAKTGSLSHVNALSGYAGDRYAFSILVNNSKASAGIVRGRMDRIALALLQ